MTIERTACKILSIFLSLGQLIILLMSSRPWGRHLTSDKFIEAKGTKQKQLTSWGNVYQKCNSSCLVNRCLGDCIYMLTMLVQWYRKTNLIFRSWWPCLRYEGPSSDRTITAPANTYSSQTRRRYNRCFYHYYGLVIHSYVPKLS